LAESVTCIECGDELNEERVQLGYRYCTKQSCQDRHRRGVTVTAIGLNKSADTFVVADSREIRRRGESGEFAKKDSALGLDYRGHTTTAAASSSRAPARPAQIPTQRRPAARRSWTLEQEKIVRLYHSMGLSPRQIVERARDNVPGLAITEGLAIQIMSSRPR